MRGELCNACWCHRRGQHVRPTGIDEAVHDTTRYLRGAAELERAEEQRMAELERLTLVLPCMECGKPARHDGDEMSPPHFCGVHGGRKRQRRLERVGFADLLERRMGRFEAELATRRQAKERSALPAPAAREPENQPEPEEDLDAVRIEIGKETTVSEEKPKRTCETCDRPLGGKAKPDTTQCYACRFPADAAKKGMAARSQRSSSKPSAPRPATPRKPSEPAGDVEQRFDTVVAVLGLDRDQVLRGLMASWLDDLKAKFSEAA
jgi:hypothetical protein